MALCNFVLYLVKFGRIKATADHLIFEREEHGSFAFMMCPHMNAQPPSTTRKMSQELSIHQEVCSTAELCCWTDFWKMLPAEGMQPSLPMYCALHWEGCVSRIPSSSPQDLISAQPGAAGPCPSGVAGNWSLLFCHCPVQLWSLQSSLIRWWSSKVLLTSKLMKLIGGVFSTLFPCPWSTDVVTLNG